MNNRGYAVSLSEKTTVSQRYNFKNHHTTKYVLGFFAKAWGHDCTLKVTLSGKNITKTFNVSYYGQYYAIEVFGPTDFENSGTITFENVCSLHSLNIDNVTLSPINEYIQSEYDCKAATQTITRIIQGSKYTAKIGTDNRVQEETYEDRYSGYNTKSTIEYNYEDTKIVGDWNKQTVTAKTQYIDSGVIKTETKQTDTYIKDTAVNTEVTFTGADGTALKTRYDSETDIYGYPLKEIGVNGEKTYYFYENTQNNYRLVKKICCNDTSTVAAGASHDSHTYDYVQTYTYNSYGECSSISDGTNTNSVTDYHNGGSAIYSGSGQSWKTDVNVYGNPTAIYENGNSVKQIQYTYGSNQNLSRATYNRSSANQSYVDYTYDSYGNLSSEKWYDKNGSSATATNSASYSYTYDYANYKQTVVSDGMSYAYQTYLSGNPFNNKITVSGNNYNANYTYTSRSDGYLSSSVYSFGNFTNGLTRTYTPQYNNKKQIVSEKDGNDFKSEYTYDAMGRVTKYSVTNNSKEICNSTYNYGTKSGNQYTVNLVTSKSGSNAGSTAYGYDALGRIITITQNRTTKDTISYDKYNRLSSIEINGYNGTWYTYNYDSNNNLTEIGKREPNGPPTTSTYKKFSYNSKNQLTSYLVNGTTKYYSYDNMGNPVKYGVSSSGAADNMVWTQGTKLASGSYKGNSFSYKYNADGLRYEKTVNGITMRQYLEGNKVIAEEELNTSGTVAHTKYYIYDQTGIAGMVYDGSTYYFEKNLFGDVTAIYNSSGGWVDGYSYDLWGAITSGGYSDVGKANPFRYRGYYYDTETGFYYLQSRYYDPQICRFISADNLEIIPSLSQTAGQLNLYAYCNNNPVMYSDPSGEFPLLAVILGATALVGMGLTIGGVASNNNALTAVGLSMVAIPALISGGMAIVAGIGGATYLGVLGGITATAGVGTSLFASAEWQQTFTGNNWILNTGISESWYNGLMLTTAAIATIGTITCGTLSSIGKMSTPQQNMDSFQKNPNRWKTVKELVEPSRAYKGGVSTYSNYINKWTGSKLGVHKIIKGGKFVHGPHIHPWF